MNERIKRTTRERMRERENAREEEGKTSVHTYPSNLLFIAFFYISFFSFFYFLYIFILFFLIS